MTTYTVRKTKIRVFEGVGRIGGHYSHRTVYQITREDGMTFERSAGSYAQWKKARVSEGHTVNVVK